MGTIQATINVPNTDTIDSNGNPVQNTQGTPNQPQNAPQANPQGASNVNTQGTQNAPQNPPQNTQNDPKQLTVTPNANQQNTSGDQSQGNAQTVAQQAEEAKKLVNSKGLNFDLLQKEYDESNGHLSAITYDALEKAGFSRQVVDTFIRGLEAENNNFVSSVYNAAGGEQEFAKIKDFVSRNPALIDGFNQTVNGGNLAQIGVMLSGLKAQMTLHAGTSNPTILGGNASGGSVGYSNFGDYQKAVEDSRYGSDPNYTKDVVNRLMNSGMVKFK